MTKRAWLTSDSLPAGDITLQFKLPDSEAWRAQLRGALLLLTESQNFEAFGSVSPQQQADTWLKYVLEFFEEKQSMLPAGVIAPYGGGTLPEGWLWCDGSLLNIADYPDLFLALQWVHGGYDETESQFKVPDLRGRTIMGHDPAQGEFSDLGSKAGNKQVSVLVNHMPPHTHSIDPHTHIQDPHRHTFPTYRSGSTTTNTLNGQQNQNLANMNTSLTTATNQATGLTTLPAGMGSPLPILPPYMALKYIIKF